MWWVGAFTLPVAAVLGLRRRDRRVGLLCAGFLSVFLPWVLVTRIAFLYHYYTAVPFLVLSIVYCLQAYAQQPPLLVNGPRSTRLCDVCKLCGLPLFAFLLFLIFFPVLSGAATSNAYVDSLEWFSTWIFS